MKDLWQKWAVSGMFVTLLALSCIALADEPTTNPSINPAFEKIKQLAGHWQGKAISPITGKEETMNVSYEVTSGGKAVVERCFVGTPYEMISVYYPEGQGVGMTHYCMIGNRPKLSLKKSDDQSLSFEMDGTSGLNSPDEPHMGGITLTFEGHDKLKEEATCNKGGQHNEQMTINLTRQ